MFFTRRKSPPPPPHNTRVKLRLENLEDRTVPTSYFTWNGGYANNNFDDARNWYRGGTGPLPGFGDSLHFVNDPVTNVANPVNNFHAAAGGPYYAVTVNFDSTVTLSTAIITETFNMQKGNTSQDADGQDITVNASFGWTFGNINTSSYSGNLILARRIPYIWSAGIAPGGGTVSTGNTIKFQNGATGTMNPGTVLFTGGNGVEINAYCGLTLLPTGGTAYFSGVEYGPKLEINQNAWVEVREGEFFLDGYCRVDGGRFTLMASTSASFSGKGIPMGNYAYAQWSGATELYGGSTLQTGKQVTFEGGSVATIANSLGNSDASIEASLIKIDGADIYIGQNSYDPHHFGTLNLVGPVAWTSGTFHPVVDGAVDWGDSDRLRMTDLIAGAAATISPVSNTAGHLGAPTSGNHWQLVRLTNGSIGGGGPAYDTNVWGIDTVGMNNMVIGWDLRAK